jgi:hypothetical protein
MLHNQQQQKPNVEEPANKKHNPDGGLGFGGGGGGGGLGLSDLSKLLDSKFEVAAKRSETHISGQISGLREEMSTMDQKHDKKHAEANAAISALETKINDAVQSFTAIAATNATAMQQSADAAINSARSYTSAPPDGPPPGGGPAVDAELDPYNRRPIPSRLKLFATLPITVESATLGAKAMCDKADIPESAYKVSPLGLPGLGKLYAIDFVSGDDKTNSLRADKARLSLRNADGTWAELLVATPADGNCKAYINKDKGPRAERVEKLTKILFNICKTQFPQKRFFMDRNSGTIKCDWTPIASIAAPTSAEFRLRWNRAGLSQAGIEMEPLATAFGSATGGAANVEWSS